PIVESSDDNTNVVNAPREPIVVNQDPDVKSSQDPPQIDQNCCYECGDSLDGIFCRQCICKSCGKGAHFGYNCPPKDSIISKLEPCNQTINEIPQTLPSLDPPCFSLPHVSKPNLDNDPPNVFNQPPQPQFETYLCELCGNNAHYGYDCSPQFPFVYEQEPFRGEKIDEEYERDCEIRIQKLKQDFNEWGSEDDSIPLGDIIARNSTSKAITPDLPIEEPDNSLNMGDEHLDTIPATESDEVIKSSVENLVPIPSEFEGISDDSCDMPICDIGRINVESDLLESLINRDTSIDYSSKIDPIFEEFAGELAHIAPIPPGIVEADFDSNDDTSSDDDDFEDIEYVSLEEVNEVDQEEKEFDLEDILQIQDVILREKLLNVHRLISNIESLKDNPIPIVNSDSSDSSLSFSDNSLPEFETFSDHMEETRSGSTTTHANYSLPEYDSFLFEIKPEPPDVEICLHFEPDALVIDNFNELNDDQRGSEIDFSEDDDSFTFVIRTFLPFLTYPEVSPLSCSTGSEDTIFDPDIST
ncbi:hypothetical protein Tco_1046238, partial [Tanacetum coccineum]